MSPRRLAKAVLVAISALVALVCLSACQAAFVDVPSSGYDNEVSFSGDFKDASLYVLFPASASDKAANVRAGDTGAWKGIDSISEAQSKSLDGHEYVAYPLGPVPSKLAVSMPEADEETARSMTVLIEDAQGNAAYAGSCGEATYMDAGQNGHIARFSVGSSALSKEPLEGERITVAMKTTPIAPLGVVVAVMAVIVAGTAAMAAWGRRCGRIQDEKKMSQGGDTPPEGEKA